MIQVGRPGGDNLIDSGDILIDFRNNVIVDQDVTRRVAFGRSESTRRRNNVIVDQDVTRRVDFG